MGGTAEPGGSVRNVTDQGKPGSQGRFRTYETVTSGFGPGKTVAAVGSRPGEIEPDAVQVDHAVNPDVPRASVR